MGSWNSTCGITQLPIVEGDKVIMFPLIRNAYGETEGGGVCYSHNFYKPLSVPVIGDYDSYGRLKNIKNEELQFNHLSYILQNSIKNKNLSNKDIYDLIYNIERRRFKDVGFMLVHYDIYNKIIGEIGNRIVYGKDMTFREMCFQSANKLKKEANKNINAIFSLSDNKFYRFLTSNNLLYFLEDLKKENSKDLLSELVNFMIFTEAMEILRKLWIIQSGAGSQDDELFTQKIIAEFMIKREKEAHEYYKREYEDYGDVKDEIGKVTIF